jgi:beta-lysine 5,6-aminomutase alpha subunit
MSKLYLDPQKVTRARQAASEIADSLEAFILERTTVAVERTVLRLYGLDGVDSEYVPLPNVVVEQLKDAGVLQHGAARYVINAVLQKGLTVQQVGEEVAEGLLDLTEIPLLDEATIRAKATELATESLERIRANRAKRDEYLATLGEGARPYIYVIVATGNIYEDVVQAKAAARQGADIIAVIRSTGQSLIDYVPYGATTEGFGGTYATQENFRIMREALDEVGEEIGRYIRLCNYCSGL